MNFDMQGGGAILTVDGVIQLIDCGGEDLR